MGWNYTPKDTTQQSQNQQTKQVQTQPSNQSSWTCSCGTVNTTNFCGNCGSAKPLPKSLDWTCVCGTVNTTKFCTTCGKPKGQKQAQQPLQQKQVQQPVQQKQALQGNPFKNADIGDYIKFGNYPQTANGDSLPIEWLILAKEDNKILVISRYGLEVRRFDSDSNDWKNSEIRQWLNDEFYNKAFNANEKKLISHSSIFTTVYKGGFLGFGRKEELTESYDKVFLLSKEESEKYFDNGVKRKSEASICKATEYAVKNGIHVSDNGYSSWLLRSPFDDDGSNYVRAVDSYGYIIGFFRVSHDYELVRPALWINL